jgi:hypothetical protein
MFYAAVDIHKRTFQAAVLDADTGETSERRFAATRDELNDSAMPLQGKLVAAAIEATDGLALGVARAEHARLRRPPG